MVSQYARSVTTSLAVWQSCLQGWQKELTECMLCSHDVSDHLWHFVTAVWTTWSELVVDFSSGDFAWKGGVEWLNN